ncbi:MAG TPA: FxsA family protein [Solirubrobacteraceae bacterium]|jgi:UPF0716 protein FxsA|nr:FxsA family protein [Solirubrobacteraceae bacterium]
MVALLLLILWPVAELLVAIKVAQLIGVLATLLALAITWPLGVWLLRAEGRSAWRRFRAAAAAGQAPGTEVVHGALGVAGGALLIVPGFISDLVGLVLLAPPTRALLRIGLIRNLRSRVFVRFAGGSRRYDVDSTATEVQSPRLPR